MRKLASVQKIEWIKPIEGKDRIALFGILGWSVICQKTIGEVGDNVVYCEIDSVLPEKEEFEFLRSKKFHIKTMKMSGVISQGICFPMSILPERKQGYKVGDDVTDIIGVTEFTEVMDDPVAPGQKSTKKKNPLMRFALYRRLFGNKYQKDSFPSEYLSKTDETRIQSTPWLLEDKKDKWIATEKVDGTSGTFLLVKKHKLFKRTAYEYMVCSRNRRLPVNDGSVYWQVSDKYMIKEKLMNMIGDREWIAIQGECIAPKVQKNKYGVSEPHMYVFNLLTPKGRWGSVAARDYLGTRGFDFVPIVDEDFKLPDTVDEMITLAHGKSMLADTLREGLVVRSCEGTKSFKAVDPEFLLKWSE